MIIVRKTILLLILNLVIGQNWIQYKLIERQFNQAVEYYNEGMYAKSETILEKILAIESGEFTEPTLLLLIKAQIGLNRNQSAKESTRRFFEKYPESEFMKNVMESLGDLYVNEGNYSSAYRMYHRAKKLSVALDFNQKVDSKIQHLIQIRLPDTLLDELLTLEVDTEIRNVHLIAKANSQILNGHPDDGALALNQVDLTQLPDIFYPLYENLLRATYEPPRPVMTVGIVIPMSGIHGETGDAFLSGFYDGNNSNGSAKQRLFILVQDSRSDDLETIKVAKNLASLNQISALISPMDDQSSITIASSLESTNIPIIVSHLQQNDLSEINNLVYQINSTIAMQAKAAANYAINILGLDSLAVLAPSDKFGEVQTDAFIQEVDRLGGTIVVTEWYSGQPKNLRRQFKFIRKVAFSLLPKEDSFDQALGMEIDSLDALFDISADDFFDLPEPEKEKMSSSDSAKVVLTTIQGIYLPINKNDLEYIGPQIPMYNLNTKIIGNDHWQNSSILQKENIGPHLKGMSIITNFYKATVDSLEYEGELLNTYYRGHNTAKLLTLLDLESQTRQSVSQSLESIDFYSGEGFYYSPDRSNPHINAAFQILEFDGRGFIHLGVIHGDSLRLVVAQNP
ncbi:MAG: penicillin-binding protein activator [Candidatus Marinimicrobia bacterium]|nr:penicillin-binding protein activator [Candidatus Neomarinimicrobiota bacterium]